MTGPRERSRQRGRDREQEYELQNRRNSHHSLTTQSSSDVGDDQFIRDHLDAPYAHSEDLYDNRYHDHPQNLGAQRLDREILRACKERAAVFLEMCKEGLAMHGIRILSAIVICVLVTGGLIWAFRGLDRNPEASDYGPDRITHTTTIKTHLSPTSISTRYVTVQYVQFHGARPVHHEAPMAVQSDLKPTGQVADRDLSHSHVVTVTSAPVPGLYFMSTSAISGGWPQTQQDSRPSSGSASNNEWSPTLRNPSFGGLESEAKISLKSREIDAPHNLSPSQADADTTSFASWGVEVLYDLRRHSRRGIPLSKASCIQEVCSPHKRLSSMCNTSKTIADPFRKQECEWCWPEDQRKEQEIENHCMEVSKRALNAILIICSIFLFCTIFVVAISAMPMLRRKRSAKADRTLHKHESTDSPLQEKTNNIPSHWFSRGLSYSDRSSGTARIKVDDRAISKRSRGETEGQTPWYKPVFAKLGKRLGMCPEEPPYGQLRLKKKRTKNLDQEVTVRDGDERAPVLAPAPPAISSRVFSDIEDMGQGDLLSGPGKNNIQQDGGGAPRQFSRQSRAVSSGSEQIYLGSTSHRDAGAGPYNLQRLPEPK